MPHEITVIMPRATASIRAAMKQARRKARRLLERRRWAQMEVDWSPRITFWRNAVRYVFRYDPIYGAAYVFGRRTPFATPEEEGFPRPRWQREDIAKGYDVWDWDDIEWPGGFAPA